MLQKKTTIPVRFLPPSQGGCCRLHSTGECSGSPNSRHKGTCTLVDGVRPRSRLHQQYFHWVVELPLPNQWKAPQKLHHSEQQIAADGQCAPKIPLNCLSSPSGCGPTPYMLGHAPCQNPSEGRSSPMRHQLSNMKQPRYIS